MTVDSEDTRQIFQSYVDEHGASGQIGSLAAHLAAGSLRQESVADIVGRHPPEWLKPALVDLLLFYVSRVLADHQLTPEEKLTVKKLKLLFRIKEGMFLAHRPSEVAIILAEQLERMLHDDYIDDSEALLQVDLQRTFDLSYDQYLALTRPAVAAAIERLNREIAAATSAEKKSQADAKLEALRTVHLLSEGQRRRGRLRS